MEPKSKKLTVIAVDHAEGNMTAFFKELPGLLVQGNDEKEITTKLRVVLKAYIARLESSEDFEIERRTLTT